MPYNNVSAGNKYLSLRQTVNYSYLLILYTSDAPKCKFCSARFPEMGLFTLLGKEKKKK
jgi:hypothetical protein